MQEADIKMKSKYVQLSPLPLDMPLEVMEMIWLYARLSEQEQKMIRDFIQKKLSENKEKLRWNRICGNYTGFGNRSIPGDLWIYRIDEENAGDSDSTVVWNSRTCIPELLYREKNFERNLRAVSCGWRNHKDGCTVLWGKFPLKITGLKLHTSVTGGSIPSFGIWIL